MKLTTVTTDNYDVKLFPLGEECVLISQDDDGLNAENILRVRGKLKKWNERTQTYDTVVRDSLFWTEEERYTLIQAG